MDASDIEALSAQTLVGDYDGNEAWAAVATLHQDGSREIFERAAAWLGSEDPIKAARGADILCQLRRWGTPAVTVSGDEVKFGAPEPMFRNESYPLIARMLENEQEPVVLNAAICALGHLDNPDAVPLLLRYQDHPDEMVRFGVTFALGCFPNDSQSVRGLLKLTSDPDGDIRDWAVFGLGVQGDADSPEIRDALLRCLDDPVEDVREEAAVGLGKRDDQRLIPKLRTMLGEAELGDRVAEAATAILGLDESPPEWTAADYKAALAAKFERPV
jgi:HEAT repeat protein